MDGLTMAEVEAMTNLLRLRRALEDADRQVVETAKYAAEAAALQAELRTEYEMAVSDWRGPATSSLLPPLLSDPVVPGP